MQFGVDAYRTSSYFFSRFWLIFLFPGTCRKASTIRATHLYQAQPKMLLIWGNCICISSSLALLSRNKHSCVLSALQCRPALCLPCHQPQNPPYGISLLTARWTTSVNASEGLTTWDAMENQIEASEQSLFTRLLVYLTAQILQKHAAAIPTLFT